MIEIQGLGKDFHRAGESVVHAIRSIDLEVAQGEFLVLLGPSGSGKTTLLRCVAGLTVPDRGELVLDGVPVYSEAKNILVPPEFRRLGMVFQSYAIWPHMTVFDNVALPLSHGKPKMSAAEVGERVRWALSLVGLEGFERRPAPLLSGGQQQRVALARAVATQPSILLMDEPLSNLDARLREEVRKEIKDLVTRLGVTVLYVTHDQTEAMELADRVAVIHDGSLLQVGSPEELYRSPGDPRVAQFFGSTNWINGVLDGPGVVQTSMGRLAVEGPNVSFEGSAVVVAARPEDIELSVGTLEVAEGNNRFTGRVVSDVFLGDHRIFTVVVKDQKLLVNSPPFAVFQGDVCVRIPKERLSVFGRSDVNEGAEISKDEQSISGYSTASSRPNLFDEV
jgi:iron(III) transport system ATP-binding protein